MIDYSKWNNIEISDDEDDTHPNIDKQSLFKWRHEARIQRMHEFNERKQKIFDAVEEARKNLEETKSKVSLTPDDQKLKDEMAKLEEKFKKLQNDAENIKKEERLMPWNVDTISKEGWSRTKINKPVVKQDKSKLSEEEREKLYLEFIKANEKKIKHFGMLSKYDDCRTYLLEEPQLVCEETANYLTLWCLNLEIEDKHDLMNHVSKQVISMQYILELAKQLECDPRSCVSSFFKRIQTAEKEYLDAYEDELKAFRNRIKERAKEKLEKAMAELEEEEKAKRLGPGGLDPADVFETLPEKLKKCFESRDINMLKEVIAGMDEDEAKYHMKRCVDSGLWVPDAKAAESEDQEEDKNDSTKEEIYSKIKENDSFQK